MKAELDAVAARLTFATAYVGDVPPDVLPPYFVVEPSPLSAFADRAVGASDGSVAFDVRVKAVAGTGAGALILRQKAFDELSPGGSPTSLTVSGRVADVVHERFEAMFTDDTVTIPATNRHPSVAVDTFQVWSSPA